jgi:hypothetical protein
MCKSWKMKGLGVQKTVNLVSLEISQQFVYEFGFYYLNYSIEVSQVESLMDRHDVKCSSSSTFVMIYIRAW